MKKKSNGSMNHVYRVVWNTAKSAWQAVCETGKSHGKTRSVRALRRAAAAFSLIFAGVGAGSGALAAPGTGELPTGGTVVGGGAAISTSGSRMDILQTTQRTAIDWNTFNIGSQAHVHFEQPTGGAALNRVLDTNASQIYGRLTSTGQVFLVNPNGVFFAPGAQVDVGGLVASTLNIRNTDFMAGSYTFEGSSSNAIINQGNITAANGGTIALIAAKISNDGSLSANGGNVLLGAGSKVTLDMGGPVKLRVENDTLETLIQNGGAIKADGGRVLLTSQAAATLATSVINNTGLIEAQTLATGEKGEIILFAHGGTANVAGWLDASAPHGGNGGFIETSAADVRIRDDITVTAAAPFGNSGKWLIDPTDITIAATSCSGANCIAANTIASTLNSGTDVTIATSATATGSERGDINVNADIAWNQSTLVLSAHNDIWVRGNLTGTGSAKLGLEYGQASSASSNNITTYTVLGSIALPANSFYAKFGSDGSTAFTNMPVFLNNGFLRFGNGTQDSVDQYGSLRQPFYYNSTDRRWYKLTYSDSSMFLNIGFNGAGYADGTIISNQYGKDTTGLGNFDSNPSAYIGATTFDVSGYANGRGTIIATNTVADGGVSLVMENKYTLLAGQSYLESTSKLTNTAGGAVDNVRLWSGTRDDWIGTTDSPRKEKGNIVNGVFVPNTATGQGASVLRVTSGNEGIYFYSTSAGAETTIGDCCAPDFHLDSAGSGAPLASPQDTDYDLTGDGNYSVYSRFGNLAAGTAKSVVWYYAAGALGDLASIVTNVSQAAEIATGGGSPPPSPSPSPSPQVNAAIAGAQILPTEPTTTIPPAAATLKIGSPLAGRSSGSGGTMNPQGGLVFMEVSREPAGAGQGGSVAIEPGGLDAAGFMHVFVVAGGVSLPDATGDETRKKALQSTGDR